MGGRERGKDGMPHERENTRTGREKSFHSFISYRVGIVFLILETLHLSSRIRDFCAPKVTSAPPGISYEYV